MARNQLEGQWICWCGFFVLKLLLFNLKHHSVCNLKIAFLGDTFYTNWEIFMLYWISSYIIMKISYISWTSCVIQKKPAQSSDSARSLYSIRYQAWLRISWIVIRSNGLGLKIRCNKSVPFFWYKSPLHFLLTNIKTRV